MPKGFSSRAQQSWCFAQGKDFCLRWAHNAGMTGGKAGKAAYAKLPEKLKAPGKKPAK